MRQGGLMEEEIKEGYTRVTDILGKYSGFDDAPEYVKERAQIKGIIGEKTHEAIKMYYDCIPIGPLDDDVQPYFDSFLLWNQDKKPVPMYLEERYYDDHLKITGKIDAVMHIGNRDELILVDWKTTCYFTKKTSISWLCQGVFYIHLLEYNLIPNVSNDFIFLQLSGKGEYPKERKFTYTADHMSDCMALLQGHRKFNPLKEEK
jgi:hypothetical protein